MIKKLAAVVALGFAAMSAQAADYVLISYQQCVPFGCAAPSEGSSGTATVTGTSVTANVSWAETLNVNATVNYTGNWSTTLGNGVDIIKLSETCVSVLPSRVCGNDKPWTNRNGLVGNWISGQDLSGAPDVRYYNNVAVVGNILTIVRGSQFIDDPASFFYAQPCPGGCNVATWTFEEVVIPVPAAVWLFGSALGLMAWVRRRTAA